MMESIERHPLEMAIGQEVEELRRKARTISNPAAGRIRTAITA